MPFVPVVAGAQVELISSLFFRPCENTFWFKADNAAYNVVALADITSVLDQWYGAAVMPLLSSDLTYLRAVGTDMRSAGGVQVESALGETGGGIDEPAYPANVSAKITFRSTTGTLKRAGGNYLPGIPQSAIVGNRLQGWFMNSLFDAYNLLQDLARSHQWTWIVASRFLNGSPRSVAVTGRVVTAIIEHSYTAQRRRRLHNEVI
jgi:hypothetical protein